MRKRQKFQKTVPFFLTQEKRKQIWGSSQFLFQVQTKENSPICVTLRMLVQGSLEDKSDVALLAAQLLGAEWAGSMKGVCTMWQRDLTPEGCRLL